MGLQVSHDAYRGSYTGFGAIRVHAAELAGWEVTKKKKQFGMLDGEWEYPDDQPAIQEHNLLGLWLHTPADPLTVLMAHLDTDGYIYFEQQIPLAERLEELAEKPGAAQRKVGDESVRICLRRFAQGLRLAHDNGMPLEFS